MKMFRTKIKTALLLSAAFALPVYAQDGFSVSVGDETVAGDSALAQSVASRPRAFDSRAKVLVTVDGLGVQPRLDLEVENFKDDRIALRSRLNYPAWVTRAEVRLVDLRAPGGPKLLQVLPIVPNGTLELRLPEGENLAASLRVYDAKGRYDETVPVRVSRSNDSPEEEGIDRAGRRMIPISGGAVTVSGHDLANGAVAEVFGETITPDLQGDFVIQRILPVGERILPVWVHGGGEAITLDPVVSIPKVDWFGVGRAELTFGHNLRGPEKGDNWDRGQLAFYVDGRTAQGWEITASADTGEERIGDLFRNFDEKNPLGLISRLDPDLAYPTYGDDAELINNAPSDGKFYIRATQAGSHIMWGNAKAPLDDDTYLRTERSLYGLSGLYRTPATTKRGDAKVTFKAYAAQPDMLPGRDIFLGTGGSVYFLRRQDISTGSETVTIQLRDPDTGRVISTAGLVEGEDYQINYVQGVITLNAPLSSLGSSDGIITAAPGNSSETYLVVQYEYTPGATDLDGFAYGGRVEGWVTDDLRLGFSGTVDRTDTADQSAAGADFLWHIGEQSYVKGEVARSSGPGFGFSTSDDAGLIFDSTAAQDGTGDAARLEASLEFSDIGLRGAGNFAIWAERREAGFSTIDSQTTADEHTVGFEVTGQPVGDYEWKLRAEDYRSDDGTKLTKGLAELTVPVSTSVRLGFGLAHEDRVEPSDVTETGRRTDAALRLTMTPTETLEWYVFGQTTIARSGARKKNDRAGVGLTLDLAKVWTFEGEISGGSYGAGGKARVSYESKDSLTYLGYELDPERELDGVTLDGRDMGQVVAGGRRKLNDAVMVFGESKYDMFGRHRALTNSYGVEYKINPALTFSSALELGRIDDPDGDFDRKALSFGVVFSDGEAWDLRARAEFRRDEGTLSGSPANTDSVALLLDGRYRIDDARRWAFSVEAADTVTAGVSLPEGQYAKATVGYAFRPTDNDRLNLIARYTYLRDMYGQSVDGASDTGVRQQSHVASIDAIWEANARWTLGAKLGARLSKSAPDDDTPLTRNNAALGVINARYHLTHKWDTLAELRHLEAFDANFSETGFLTTLYRHVGPNAMIGLGYNFGNFSDDLTDLTTDDQGVFINLVTHF